MKEYIERDVAICIADYAADEHPYDKDPAKPETFTEYNQGWNDACDYIRERVEQAEKTDAATVRYGKLIGIKLDEDLCNNGFCSECGGKNTAIARFCNWCGAKMDGGDDNA